MKNKPPCAHRRFNTAHLPPERNELRAKSIKTYFNNSNNSFFRQIHGTKYSVVLLLRFYRKETNIIHIPRSELLSKWCHQQFVTFPSKTNKNWEFCSRVGSGRYDLICKLWSWKVGWGGGVDERGVRWMAGKGSIRQTKLKRFPIQQNASAAVCSTWIPTWKKSHRNT